MTKSDHTLNLQSSAASERERATSIGKYIPELAIGSEVQASDFFGNVDRCSCKRGLSFGCKIKLDFRISK